MKKIYIKNHIIYRIIIIIFVLAISIVYTGVKTNSNIAEVFSQKKELPIYSVDVDEKKIAISFDAAWEGVI